MYEIPSMDTVEKCIIDATTVTNGEAPVLLDGDGSRIAFVMPERPAA
jgi:ATP-dependent protease Clp ATPase subunit